MRMRITMPRTRIRTTVRVSYSGKKIFILRFLAGTCSLIQPVEECTLPLGKKQIGLYCVVG
nr:MAG TPA: hypothetical protein [Caudoviricetes sp.]